jgi:uncharacterized protein
VWFSNQFDLDAPPDRVFDTLLDIERVASCVPGAQVLERNGEADYVVAIKVKLGPIAMQYKGTLRVADVDRDAHVATMQVRAKETRGQGNAEATSRLTLAATDDGTRAEIDTEVKLTGKAAAMGGRMVGDVSAAMIDTFAANLATMLARPDGDAGAPSAPQEEPVEALDGSQLAKTVVRAQVGERRALPVALAAGVLLLLVLAVRRRRGR